jgi:hypothetical protein
MGLADRASMSFKGSVAVIAHGFGKKQDQRGLFPGVQSPGGGPPLLRGSRSPSSCMVPVEEDLFLPIGLVVAEMPLE